MAHDSVLPSISCMVSSLSLVLEGMPLFLQDKTVEWDARQAGSPSGLSSRVTDCLLSCLF